MATAYNVTTLRSSARPAGGAASLPRDATLGVRQEVIDAVGPSRKPLPMRGHGLDDADGGERASGARAEPSWSTGRRPGAPHIEVRQSGEASLLVRGATPETTPARILSPFPRPPPVPSSPSRRRCASSGRPAFGATCIHFPLSTSRRSSGASAPRVRRIESRSDGHACHPHPAGRLARARLDRARRRPLPVHTFRDVRLQRAMRALLLSHRREKAGADGLRDRPPHEDDAARSGHPH